jgi:hypothetical protein
VKNIHSNILSPIHCILHARILMNVRFGYDFDKDVLNCVSSMIHPVSWSCVQEVWKQDIES